MFIYTNRLLEMMRQGSIKKKNKKKLRHILSASVTLKHKTERLEAEGDKN